MKVQAVIGANYGDEGKGLVSGCLAREANKKNEKTLQGLMLDQLNRDCFPHLTPSSTGCRNIADDIRTLNPETIDLYYVSRSYLTRHGAGPMNGECTKDEINSGIIDATIKEFRDAIRAHWYTMTENVDGM